MEVGEESSLQDISEEEDEEPPEEEEEDPRETRELEKGTLGILLCRLVYDDERKKRGGSS